MSGTSYRTILRSSSIIGGAQILNIAVSMVKMKVVALLLGPAGIGLIGLYMILIQTAAAIADLGIGKVGTRQVAAADAEGGDEAVGRTRRALLWATVGLALTGAAVFWLASDWIARVILADATLASDVAFLSLGVALTVAAGSQSALLTGLRRVGDLARINVASGLISAVLGVLALWCWGAQGLIAMVLFAPAATFLLGHLYVSRLGPPAGPPISFQAMSREWRAMIPLGFALMVGGLVTMLGQLAVRALVQRELGQEALGQFQAAWVIGMTYLGLVLSAMATDYYPRLVAVIGDNVTATRLINEQTEVALLLSAPVLLALLGLAPWVVPLLYSADFGPAAEILRWQLLGDVLKLMSWPLGYVIVAFGAGKTFVLTEALGTGVFLLVAMVGLPLIGVNATGVAFVAHHLAYLPFVWWFARRRIGFRWTLAVKSLALVVIGSIILVEMAARWSSYLSASLGVAIALAMAIWALQRLSAKVGTGGRLGRIAAQAGRVMEWTIKLK